MGLFLVVIIIIYIYLSHFLPPKKWEGGMGFIILCCNPTLERV